MAALVQQAQGGNKAALSSLIGQTEQRVFNLAYRILQNRQEAEDLCQEIFLRMWRALPEFRGESKFTTWLHTIATNACLNRRRKLRRELTAQTETDEELEHLIADSSTEPSREGLGRDEREQLWAEVNKLPAKYVLVLTLFYQQQLSYEEIARILDLPLGTVKAQLSRARRALAASLSKDGETL